MDTDLLFEVYGNRSRNIDDLDKETRDMDLAKCVDSLDGKTLLHVACDKGDLELAKYLIEKRNLPPLLFDKFQNSTLHNAAWSGKVSLLKYLIEDCKCKVDVEDEDGKTPLLWSSASGNIEAIEYLIGNGADIHKKTNQGYTICTEACKKGHLHVLKYLVENCKLDIHIKDNNGEGCLHWTCRGGDSNREVIHYLVEDQEMDVNQKNNNGETPIFICIMTSCDCDQYENVQYLIDHGAKTKIKNKEGQTLMEVAEEYENDELMDLISED